MEAESRFSWHGNSSQCRNMSRIIKLLLAEPCTLPLYPPPSDGVLNFLAATLGALPLLLLPVALPNRLPFWRSSLVAQYIR
jgi:hypothetical protein